MTPTRRKVSGNVVTVTIVVVIIVAVSVVAWLWNQGQQAQLKLAQKYQFLMGLTPVDGKSGATGPVSPDFHLTDQHGQQISMSSLHGKVVVLEFMDPKCTDICPIVSQEIVDANKLLGAKASDVVFLGINVNQYHESQADVQAFSSEHGLSKLSNWHFLTGTTAQLKQVWHAYGIQVIPNPTGDVQHSSLMYFIAKDGTERYLADPTNSNKAIPDWGRGIQFVARQLI